MKTLVIVESPTKAKTISKFLGSNYKVESSFGHVMDLPAKGMGIDIEHNFEPTYEVPDKAKKQVAKLKTLAKTCGNVLFATDKDREGEAIAWHLKTLLKPKKYQRITFHEITPTAIKKSLEKPQDIDQHLVDAQQARRVLDRLVGYELSPFLWKKVARGLSAGRVQSVAVRMIVEREKEIKAFKPEEYWTLEATFDADNNKFEAKLHAQDGKSLKKFDINNKKDANELVKILNEQKYKIAKVETKEHKKKVPTPFKTSTLQQTAHHKLGFSAKQTMRLAQQLYEGIDIKGKGAVGLITYMRTDSLNLSSDFLNNAQDYIQEKFGKQYVPAKPRVFKTKSKGAQEAHEAIRPTHVDFAPEDIKDFLDARQYKLYNLIWSRALASQMNEAVISAVAVDVNSEDDKYCFRATGQTIKFDGFLKIYQTDTQENLLPELKEKQKVELEKLDPNQHFTQPPARFSEATLVKALEEHEIGRPSTYAPTISTIQDRNYVEKEDKKLKPTDIAFVVTELLEKHFPDIVDYEFTAELEDDLDKIAHGKRKWQPMIKNFYMPFHKNLKKKEKEVDKKKITEEKTEEVCEKCGSPMVIKIGRFGKFLACTGFPECKNTKDLEEDGHGGKKKIEPETLKEKCPECGKPLVQRRGRFGPFIGCSGYPDCKYIKKEGQKNDTGLPCPKCGEGHIVSRRGKRAFFYGCSKYPACDFISWDKPLKQKCPKCEQMLVETKKGEIKCSNENCNYHVS